jgi:hypothetical protein
MSKIINLFNSGKKSVKTGVVNVNSRNVYPTTLVALPTTGLALGIDLIDGYEHFNVAQTSAGTDFLTLPVGCPVGTVIEFFAVSACKVEAPGSETINGVANTTDITMPINTFSALRKVSTTRWILTQYSTAGAISAPIA